MTVTCLKREVEIRGVKYIMIFQNGEPVLKRFDKKYKMWVTLSFAKDGNNDQQIVNDIRHMITEMFAK